MSTKYPSIFKDPQVIEELSCLHDKYVVVPADKASNNIVFVCKKHYIDCLIKELGINNTLGNPTYTLKYAYKAGDPGKPQIGSNLLWC